MRKLIRISVLLPTLCITLAAVMSLAAFEMISLNKTSREVLMVQLRLKELNYFSYKATGSYGSMSRDAVIRFQQACGMMTDGVVGEETFNKLFTNEAPRAPIADKVKIPIGPTNSDPPNEYGALVKWEEIDPLFSTDQAVELSDLNTGKTLRIMRVAGVHHARVETASTTDTATFLEIFGGTYNWSKRPVMVTISGQKYAASLQGMPQGEDLYTGNDMEGACALYFEASTSDISNLPDSEHRMAVRRAAGNGW